MLQHQGGDILPMLQDWRLHGQLPSLCKVSSESLVENVNAALWTIT